MKKALAILKPIGTHVTRFQRDNAPVSDVYQGSVRLAPTFQQLDEFSEEERELLVELSNARFRFVCKNAHKIGNLLDHRYLGDGMASDLKGEVEELLFKFFDEAGTSVARWLAVGGQCMKFRISVL